MTSIYKFFSDKTLLITGATGFLGKPLVAKILTDIPTVKKIYLLMRERVEPNGKIKTAQVRLENEFFRSSVFDRLREIHGTNFESWIESKVFAIEGELKRTKLGIDDEIYDRLIGEVEIFINSAAIVKFDAPIDDAVRMNVLAAKNAIEFAKACESAIFVHVSTAYSCGSRPGKVAEELHTPYEILAEKLNQEGKNVPKTFDDELKNMLEFGEKIRSNKALSKKELEEKLTKIGLEYAVERGWNDIYTYTKALGEDAVSRTRGALPVAIVRPSIIESSLEEPTPGWLDGLRMADPLIIGFGKGRLPDFPAKPNIIIDIIPVDFVVNVILAAAQNAHQNRSIEVYHASSGSANPIRFRDFYQYTVEYFQENPMLDKGKAIAVPSWDFPTIEKFNAKIDSSLKKINFMRTILKYIPTKWASRKNRQLAILQNSIEHLLYYVQIYGAYTRLEFRFETNKTQKLQKSLSDREQKIFNFDATRIDWQHYLFDVHIPGIKRFVLKMENAEEKIETEYQNIPEILTRRSELSPDKIALQMKRNGEWVRYSYGQFQELSRKIAYSLHNRGFRKGDKVILFSENQPEWGITYFALSQIGAIVVPIDSQTSMREVFALSKFTSAKAVITTENLHKRQVNFVETEKIELLNINNFCLGFEAPKLSATDLATFPENFPTIKIDRDDITSIIFTSGTIVDPRGAMLSHGNFIYNLLTVAEGLEARNSDQLMSLLPLYHALEFTAGFLMAIHGGATVTYLGSMRPNVMLETMHETKTTAIIAVPRLLKLLYDAMMRYILKGAIGDEEMPSSEMIEKVQNALGSRLRAIVSGGAMLPDSIYDNFKKFGITIYQGYGLTESAPVLSVNSYGKSVRSSVGQVLRGTEIFIENPDASGLGEIVAEGPGIMRGYYENPRATAKMLRNGKLYTGDIGKFDVNKNLYITGRIKEVIVSGAGKNVYPAELEALYSHQPSISEICVVGIARDDGIGEEVHAVVVPHGDCTEEDIREHLKRCSDELPSYQRLHKIHFRATKIPRKENSTFDRDKVREEIKDVKFSVNRKRSKNPEWKDSEFRIISELSRLARIPAEEIASESELETELGLDSLMKVELLLFLESELGRSIPEEIALSIGTVAELLEKFAELNAEVTGSEPAIEFNFSNGKSLSVAGFRSAMRFFYNRYFSLECHGLENIPKGEKYIIASNHTSHLDSGAIMTALGDEADQLITLGAKDYFFDTKVKSWFFSKYMNVLPFDRTSSGSLQGLRISQEALDNDRSLLIYPEGTRSIDGSLQEFKVGLGFLAHETGVPVIPTYIEGTYEAMPKGQNFPSQHKIRLTFGEPITVDRLKNSSQKSEREEYQKFVDSIQRQIEILGENLKSSLPER